MSLPSSMSRSHSTIRKVLIANRAEIARRVQRACQKLKIKTLSVASEADRNSLHAREAEELVVIGPPQARESYLKGDALIAVALERGCDAIHPGYGFLSENAEFARKVEEAGLTFIGPSWKTIAALGSKTEAKAIAARANVPCAPNSAGGLNNEALIRAAEKIGYPVLVKAVAGGGGRGMRVAHTAKELEEALPRARGEALKFFANEDVYLEKLIDSPRHVEVQVLGDKHGNLIHLGTRDCSTQRRHQKLIEEAPAPKLDPNLREEIHQAALRATREAGYYNAGTVEFLVKDDEFFFLEVNTRIQVEHPVTEAITGLDLVELQLRIAQGEPLPLSQEDVQFDGHAIEFRICAEDPADSFRPATGVIERLFSKPRSYVREDAGFIEGDSVSQYYDSLLSKIIVKAGSRGECIDKSIEFLSSYELNGLPTTIALHLWVLYNSRFRRRPLDIGYVEREFSVKELLDVRAGALRDTRWNPPITLVTGSGISGVSNQVSSTDSTVGDSGTKTKSSRRFQGDTLGERSVKSNPDISGTKEFEGAIVKNVYQYQSEKFKTTYTIEVLHKRDGFFVAVPVDASGRRGKSNSCRMSNGLNTVMHSIINDVLEKTPPSEIFQLT